MLFEKYGRQVDDFLASLESKLFIKRVREADARTLIVICHQYEQKIKILEDQFMRQHQMIKSQRAELNQINSDYSKLVDLYQAASQPKRRSRKKAATDV